MTRLEEYAPERRSYPHSEGPVRSIDSPQREHPDEQDEPDAAVGEPAVGVSLKIVPCLSVSNFHYQCRFLVWLTRSVRTTDWVKALVGFFGSDSPSIS